jgi:uncharacterized protein
MLLANRQKTVFESRDGGVMEDRDDKKGVNRRDFLKIGVAGAAAAMSANGMFGLLHAAPPLTSPVYRALGRTGLKVTTVGMGAMLTPEYEVIRAAIDMGVNYVDTARRYMNGRNEEIVGKALKGVRDKVYVATKTQPGSNTKGEIIKDVETSLKNLQTDRIDVIQLHSLDSPRRAFIPEVREAYAKLRQQGKVRFFGVTTHTNQAEVIEGIVNDPDRFFDTVLVGYNFKSASEVKAAIARAAKAGIGVIAMKTQAGGYQTPQAGSISPHQAALKWVLQDTNVATSTPGMKTLSHINELVPVMGMRLTQSDQRMLQRYAHAIDPFYCGLCAQCEATCPNGVRISVVNRALMYADGYGEHQLARSTYYEEAKGANGCSMCSECVAICINRLDIADKMRRARSIFA